MSKIPEIKCPECGALMEYRGGPSDSNIFIMVCITKGCGHQETCYAEAKNEKSQASGGFLTDAEWTAYNHQLAEAAADVLSWLF